MKKVVGRFVSNGFWVSLSAVISAGTLHAQDEEYLIEEEVIVQGVRQADLNARAIERSRDVFSSVIAPDDIGNFADQNVAEALQRLPGVTLTKTDGQGEFVNVRGLSASFVGVTINNSELASSSTDTRAVGLNSIPADLMGRIEVFKTLTPDMDLNGIAGKVNVKSVTAFDRGKDSLRLTVQGAMHEQRGEFSPKATLVGTKLLADDTVGIAVSLSTEERTTEVNQIFAEDGLRYIRVSRPFFGELAPTTVPPGSPPPSSSLEYMNRYFVDERFNQAAPGADPYIDEERMLTPLRFETRQKESERTRTAATLDLGWRPTDDSNYFVRYAHTDFTENELSLREAFGFGSGDSRYIGYINRDANVFAVGNADLRHQVSIEESNEITKTYALGAENTFADTWTLNLEYSHSESESTNPDDRRVQYRRRFLPMYGQLFQDNIFAGVLTASQLEQLLPSGVTFAGSGVPGTQGYSGLLFGGYQFGERYQPEMSYDNLLLEDGTRFDELEEYELNLRKDFVDGGFLNYVKVGAHVRNRDRIRRRIRSDVNTQDFEDACAGDIACQFAANTIIGLGFDGAGFATYTPRNPRFEHDFITVADVERLIALTRVIPQNLGLDQVSALNRAQNYDVFEDTSAAYLMAEFQLGDKTTLIAGARYAETEYGSTGWLTLRHDRYLDEDGVVRDIAIPLGDPDTGGFAVNKYDGVYPGLHLRYEPRDDLLIRSSLWTNFNRPNFDSANARAAFDDRVVLCRDTPVNEGQPGERPRCSSNLEDDLQVPNAPDHVAFIQNLTLSSATVNNELTLGNTELRAMEAANLDFSISWYGDGGDFFEVALFYKDIKDFIVPVRGLRLPRSQLPRSVEQAIAQIDSSNGGAPSISENVFRIPEDFVFPNVNTTINGDKARIYGTELSYTKFLTGGMLDGFFIQSNLTLLKSEADPGESVRADKIELPEQADVTANLTLGWENDDFSVRLINNYRGRILKQIGTCSQADKDADAEWASLNDANNPDALAGAAGSGVVYTERCRAWEDVYHDDTFTMDIKATYAWKGLKFYLDVLNVTEDVDVFYYRGNEYSNGEVLFRSEGIGRTYQVGVNYQFW
jgi:iron complex outermembrane recepter protein